jgi:hypothetical protein
MKAGVSLELMMRYETRKGLFEYTRVSEQIFR